MLRKGNQRTLFITRCYNKSNQEVSEDEHSDVIEVPDDKSVGDGKTSTEAENGKKGGDKDAWEDENEEDSEEESEESSGEVYIEDGIDEERQSGGVSEDEHSDVIEVPDNKNADIGKKSTMNTKQRTIKIEQRTIKTEQQIMNTEQHTMNTEQQTVNTDQRTMNTEQRTKLKLLVRSGKTPSQALGLLKRVYGDNTMSRTRVFEWHKRFKEGREEVEDDSRSGRPSTSRTEVNIERVKQMIRGDRRLTVRMIATELDMKKDTVWKIITEDLNMWKVCEKLVPRLLDEDQKECRMQMCQDIVECLQNEPDLLRRVIIGDETWIFEYDPETKPQNLTSPWPKKARRSKSKLKVMLITFFDVRGIVHYEFLPQDQAINKQVYKEVLQHLIRSVHEKRQELCQGKLWLLHHDNAPAHRALSIRQFLAEKNIAVLEQPPYSPDLAPCDFFLFPRLKGVIKGTRFKDVEAIKWAVTAELRSIPRDFFQQCIEAWQRRMEECIRLKGGYFGGETM